MRPMAEHSQKRRRGGAVLVSLAGLLAGGAGAYGAVASGLLDPARLSFFEKHQLPENEWAIPMFVALEPMVISLGPEAGARHLRLALQLEVAPGSERSVDASVPRIRDVLNTYLRAVDGREIETPGAMLRLRAQMLRRVQLVSPPDSVRDLLVQEFIIN